MAIEKVGVIIEEGCAILTSAFLEYFDRLSQDDYALLEHLQAHGLLAGATAHDLLEALVRARLRLADEHLAFALSLNPTNPAHRRHIISRSYYTMHHSARAVLLYHERREYSIHSGRGSVIEQFGRLFRDPDGRRQQRMLWDWHDLRLRADYNPSLAGDLLAEAQLAQLEASTFVDEMRLRLPAHLR
jgi:uncharacterized protein (UPF0332 family)